MILLCKWVKTYRNVCDLTGAIAGSFKVSVGTGGEGALGGEGEGGVGTAQLPAGLEGDGGGTINLERYFASVMVQSSYLLEAVEGEVGEIGLDGDALGLDGVVEGGWVGETARNTEGHALEGIGSVVLDRRGTSWGGFQTSNETTIRGQLCFDDVGSGTLTRH